MGIITIQGGTPLRGETVIQGAKNSALPILAASLLSGDVCRIEGCPHLSDVDSAADILRYLGCTVVWEDDDLLVDSRTLTRCDIPQSLMRRMRSSVIFLGAILARCGWAELSYPGGCELGPRPIDLHLSALRALGADISDAGGTLRCRAAHLRGCQIVLATPSVGATENAMLAACGAEGDTVICNAAREPEIVDLQVFLRSCGAGVAGAGTSTVMVEVGAPLHGAEHTVMPDRITAATYLCAAVSAGGDIFLRGAREAHLSTVTAALRELGVPAHIRGYQYLRVAITIAVDDMDVINAITKGLYPQVAEACGTTPPRVERVIRHAIGETWKRGDAEAIRRFFGSTVFGRTGRPSNLEFIALAADRLRMQMRNMGHSAV